MRFLDHRSRLAGLSAFALFLGAMCGDAAIAQPEAPKYLVAEPSIALPDTGGRIDHMAIDLVHRRLFVAELGNGTLDVVDLVARKVLHRIMGLKEPQGVGYEPRSDLLAVASGGDGTLRFYSGLDYSPRGVVNLGTDADNLRIDPRNGHVVVGYGEGAFAVVDPMSLRKLAEIPLAAHPESSAFPAMTSSSMCQMRGKSCWRIR